MQIDATPSCLFTQIRGRNRSASQARVARSIICYVVSIIVIIIIDSPCLFILFFYFFFAFLATTFLLLIATPC